jgi:hypothetical protein
LDSLMSFWMTLYSTCILLLALVKNGQLWFFRNVFYLFVAKQDFWCAHKIPKWFRWFERRENTVLSRFVLHSYSVLLALVSPHKSSGFLWLWYILHGRILEFCIGNLIKNMCYFSFSHSSFLRDSLQ